MRLLLIPAAGGVGLGPLTNALSIAEDAQRAGHEVAFLCKNAWGFKMRRFGFQTYEAPEPEVYRGSKPPSYKLSDVIIGLGWAGEAYIQASIEAERRAITSFRADVVISVLQVTVPISAAIEQVPWVAIFGWADGPDFTSPLYRPEESVRGWEENFNRVLDQYGQEPINDICELSIRGAQLKIAPTIPELQPELRSVPGTHFVGYLLSSSMEKGELPQVVEDWSGDSPIIYVYLSPGDIEPTDWIPTIVEAFRDTEFRVMVTLAPLTIPPSTLPKVDNVRFFETLPGTAAMSRSNLVISHGGLNSVINALLVGVPQMVFPDRYAERDYNGRAVERLGTGRNYRTEEFTPQDVRENARTILADRNFKLNATKIGNRIKEFGGSRKVVALIESQL